MARQAVYLAVADTIRSRIEDGDYGSGAPLPAERSLARELQVNRLTLRKALGLLEEEQILLRRQGCGTFVAPTPGPPALETILYVGETRAHFYAEFYAALCGEAQDRRRAVTAFTPETADDQTLAALRRLAAKHRRLICTEAAWHLVQTAIPDEVQVTRVSGVLSVGTPSADERPGYIVSSDTYRAAKLAVEHLVGLGHRRIGFVNYGWRVPGEPLLGRVDPQQDAYLGYRAGLNESGIGDILPLGVPDNPAVDDYQEWHCRCLVEQLARMERLPTGFLCVGDFRAAPLMRALREMNLRIPQDASVVGIGNTPWAQAVDPPLTSVCLGETQMARMAMMFNAEPEPDTARVVRVDPELVVRQSTAPAPAGNPDQSDQPDHQAPSTKHKKGVPQ